MPLPAITPAETVEECRAFVKEHGIQNLFSAKMRELGFAYLNNRCLRLKLPLPMIAEQLGMSEAWQKAEEDPNRSKRKQRMTKPECLEACKAFVDEHGIESLFYTRMAEHGQKTLYTRCTSDEIGLTLPEIAEHLDLLEEWQKAEADPVRYKGHAVMSREECIEACRDFIKNHGISKFFKARMQELGYEPLYARCLNTDVGLTLRTIAEHLGMLDEWEEAEKMGMQIRVEKHGHVFWSEEKFYEVAGDIVAKYGCMPGGDYLRKNGYSGFCVQINRYASMGELQVKYNTNVDMRMVDMLGYKWRSMPEACCANFLLAQGIVVQPGKAYPDSFKDFCGHHGIYDMHIDVLTEEFSGRMLQIEIWGGMTITEERAKKYAATRAAKTAFHKDDPLFLGIEYLDCYSDTKLAAIMKPFIGALPIVEKPGGLGLCKVSPTRWCLVEEVLKKCRAVCDNIPGGVLPPQDWFRRKQNYQTREVHDWEPENWNALMWPLQRVGYRNVRKLLAQEKHSIEENDEDQA